VLHTIDDIKIYRKDDRVNMSHKYSQYGVYCNPSTVERGQMVNMAYEGILAQNGADRVFSCVGYGPNTKWTGVSLVEMKKIGPNKFESQFTVGNRGNLNVAFKDSAEHWDNNNGQNYVFESK
jgi:hypothetical protein